MPAICAAPELKCCECCMRYGNILKGIAVQKYKAFDRQTWEYCRAEKC